MATIPEIMRRENCGYREARRIQDSPERPDKSCASCASWRAHIMECKHVPGEAAPPESTCGHWIEAEKFHL